MSPILTPDMMRAAEAQWFVEGHDSYALMKRAAEAVAAAAGDMGSGGPVLVLCGPGNNGGDGLVTARLLRQQGREVHVALLVPHGRLDGDAARAFTDWGDPVMAMAEARPEAAGLVVDALFGIGLTRPLEGAAAEIASRVNAARRPVLAVDIPSGVNGATGDAEGAFRATRTVTFHTPKPGHLLMPGRMFCGELRVADIGLPPTPTPLRVNGRPVLPMPDVQAHKYSRGACLVWSGPALMTGAARLAATAALRVGAGAVWLAGARDAMLVQAAHVTAIMVREADAQAFGRFAADPKVRSVVVGPGAGPDARCVAGAALQSGKPCLLDADAVTSFAGKADALAALIRRHHRPVVLTPHEGEFARLFPDVHGSKLDRALIAAARSGATVVLKGPDTVVAAADGRASINVNGTPWLATAGSGDVLAGVAGGLLAQGMDDYDAACAAVWLHGAAGEAAGPWLTAEDLASGLREVLCGW